MQEVLHCESFDLKSTQFGRITVYLPVCWIVNQWRVCSPGVMWFVHSTFQRCISSMLCGPRELQTQIRLPMSLWCPCQGKRLNLHWPHGGPLAAAAMSTALFVLKRWSIPLLQLLVNKVWWVHLPQALPTGPQIGSNCIVLFLFEIWASSCQHLRRRDPHLPEQAIAQPGCTNGLEHMLSSPTLAIASYSKNSCFDSVLGFPWKAESIRKLDENWPLHGNLQLHPSAPEAHHFRHAKVGLLLLAELAPLPWQTKDVKAKTDAGAGPCAEGLLMQMC